MASKRKTWFSYFLLELLRLSSFCRAASNSSSLGSGTGSPPPYLWTRDENMESTLPRLSFCRWAIIAYRSSEPFFGLWVFFHKHLIFRSCFKTRKFWTNEKKKRKATDFFLCLNGLVGGFVLDTFFVHFSYALVDFKSPKSKEKKYELHDSIELKALKSHWFGALRKQG